MEQKEIDTQNLVLREKLVHIARVAKVVKGGRRRRFRALVVVGDGNGHIGIGLGKADEISAATQKAGAIARKNLIEVPLAGTTIPYEIMAKFGAAKLLLKPAVPGTGIIAGGSARAVLEAAGVKDILTKSLGSSNPMNVVKVTMLALSRLKNPEEELAKRKSLTTCEIRTNG